MDYTQRITVYRNRILESPDQGHIEVLLRNVIATAEALRETEGQSWQMRRGRMIRKRLSNIAFQFDEYDLFAGRPVLISEPEDSEETERLTAYIDTQQIWNYGITGHCEPHYFEVMNHGIYGVESRIRRKKENCTPEQLETYESFLESLQGLSVMIENAESAARSAAEQNSGTRKDELERIAESCGLIKKNPPETFLDALQLVWFIWIGLSHGENVGCIAPGHPDRWLYPFYRSDIEKGNLTREQARNYLEYLYLLINEWWWHGSAIAVMCGGKDETGKDITNELTYLCLEALRNTRLPYPTVGVHWSEDTPDDLTQLAVDLIAEGISTPAFFNDNTIRKGLENLGIPENESCNYINSSCVEITLVGSSNIWPASPYFSLCSLLLDEIESSSGNPPEEYDEFYLACLSRIEDKMREETDKLNEWRKQREQKGRKPLQSVFTRDCIDRGIDIDAGGARYNWVECSFVGLANLADSLYVIRKEVFEEKNMTIAELSDILEKNYEGAEDIRTRFANKYPKYGQGKSEVDDIVRRLTEDLTALSETFEMYPNKSPFIPGAFVWVMHERLGGECAATPDGRIAGFAFADGAGPAQGREKEGPSAAILSVTSWDHSPFIGGIAFNMKMNKSVLQTEEEKEKFKELILTYLKRGGFEVQVNVLDRDILKKARKNPEEYKDLVVRIGGYCDFFTRLSDGMQEELIQRAEYQTL